MWVLCSIFPELTDDGEVLEIIGCITDIRYVPSLTQLDHAHQRAVSRNGERNCKLLTLRMLMSQNGKVFRVFQHRIV
jgi:hypothetical protein